MRLRRWGTASVVLYTVGIPAAFASILWVYRFHIVADQRMRMVGQGNSRVYNTNFHIRERFQKLYAIFRPEFIYWRLVLIARKCTIAAVALMLASSAMFQACLSIAIIFISYALQVHCRPYLDHLDLAVPATSIDHVKRHGAVLRYVIRYNLLEETYLLCSLFVLLCGMIFESAVLTRGTTAYLALTYIVAIVLVGSFTCMCGMVGIEIVRSLKHAKAVHTSQHQLKSNPALGAPTLEMTPRRHSSDDDEADSKRWAANPLHDDTVSTTGKPAQPRQSRILQIVRSWHKAPLASSNASSADSPASPPSSLPTAQRNVK